MKEAPLRVLCVIGTSASDSATHIVIAHIGKRLRFLGSVVDVFDPSQDPLSLFNPKSSYVSQEFLKLKTRVECADAYVFATPDYHGSISSTLKNFLDHFWQEFAGKLFAQIVCSNEKGLTVIDQLRTVARQCYAWTLPYGISFTDSTDVTGEIIAESLHQRAEMLVHDLQVYGLALRRQREADLKATCPGFLARLRPASVTPMSVNSGTNSNLIES